MKEEAQEKRPCVIVNVLGDGWEWTTVSGFIIFFLQAGSYDQMLH